MFLNTFDKSAFIFESYSFIYYILIWIAAVLIENNF